MKPGWTAYTYREYGEWDISRRFFSITLRRRERDAASFTNCKLDLCGCNERGKKGAVEKPTWNSVDVACQWWFVWRAEYKVCVCDHHDSSILPKHPKHTLLATTWDGGACRSEIISSHFKKMEGVEGWRDSYLTKKIIQLQDSLIKLTTYEN